MVLGSIAIWTTHRDCVASGFPPPSKTHLIAKRGPQAQVTARDEPVRSRLQAPRLYSSGQLQDLADIKSNTSEPICETI